MEYGWDGRRGHEGVGFANAMTSRASGRTRRVNSGAEREESNEPREEREMDASDVDRRNAGSARQHSTSEASSSRDRTEGSGQMMFRGLLENGRNITCIQVGIPRYC